MREMLENKQLFTLRYLILLGLAFVGLIGYSSWRKLSLTTSNRNVILVVIDALRVDRLGCYGNPVGLTPEIDNFSRRAVRFEWCFSHSPWTFPSIASIFTSRHPAEHGAGSRLGSFAMLVDENVTLAEVFRRSGFTTGIIANVMFFDKQFGMNQGFETVDVSVPTANLFMRPAGPTTEAALRWLDGHQSERFFLFVHYFDPHLTYNPPQPFRRRFADPQDADGQGYVFGTVEEIVNFRRGSVRLDTATIARLEKLYNGEVAYTDSEVGKLLAGISKRGLDRNTVVVITSDHGEEFIDHGGFEHGHTLYDELLHIPLLIRAPRTPFLETDVKKNRNKGHRVGTTVRHIDLAPTLCELTGIRPAPSFAGRSLAQILQGRSEGHRPVLSQACLWGWGPDCIAWRQGGFKLIRQSSKTPWRLFDISADPMELIDVASKFPEVYSSMRTDLDVVVKRISLVEAAGPAPELSEDDIERLRSLGYIR